MTDRAAALLALLDERLAVLHEVIAAATPAQWTAPCAAEGWTVGLVAYHIGRGFDRQAGWVEAALRGDVPHRFDWDETHELNASIAATHGAPTPEEALDVATASVGRIRSVIGQASDALLSRTAWLYEGHERSVEWIVGTLATRHADGHLASIRTALAAT